MTDQAKLQTLRSIAATPPASFTSGDCEALRWAIAEISRLNSRNHTLEAQSQRMADLIEDMRQTLRETREPSEEEVIAKIRKMPWPPQAQPAATETATL